MNFRPSFESKRTESISDYFEIEDKKASSNTPDQLDSHEEKQQVDEKRYLEEIARKAEKEKSQEIKERRKVEEKDKKAKQKNRETEVEKQRTQLVDQSLFYKKLYEEKPVPRDPVILARLLIADHILAIHSQIEEPDPDASVDKAQLLHSLDYMGELAHKFENPDEESTPEIQEAYEMILLRTGEAMQSTDAVDSIVDANEDTAHLPVTKEKTSPSAEVQTKAKTSLSLPATILISTLLRARKKASAISADTSSRPATDSGGSVGVLSPSSTTAIATTHPVAGRPLDSHNHTVISPVEARAAYHETIRNNHNTGPSLRSPEHIAALAVGAAFAAVHDARLQLASRPYDSSPTHDHSPQTASRESISHSTPHFESHHSPASSASHTEHMPSSHELEHLPLHSLLSMAETISIGHGQRLRSAYEHGQIDKEGLIKILKSRVKNKDFLQEYKQQVVHRRNLIQSSPEFLKSTTPRDSVDQTSNEAQEHTEAPPPETSRPSEKTQSQFLDKPPINSTIDTSLERLKQQAETTPTGWRRVLIIAGIGFVLIATIVYFITR